MTEVIEQPVDTSNPFMTPDKMGEFIYSSFIEWQGLPGQKAWDDLQADERVLYTEFMYQLCRMSQKAVMVHFIRVTSMLIEEASKTKGLQNRKEKKAAASGVLSGLRSFNGIITLADIDREIAAMEKTTDGAVSPTVDEVEDTTNV